MEFIKALKSAAAKGRRRAGTRTYIRNGELYLSRLFGYQLVDGQYLPDPRYEPAIRTIFDMLASGATLPSIKSRLDEMNVQGHHNSPARVMIIPPGVNVV